MTFATSLEKIAKWRTSKKNFKKNNRKNSIRAKYKVSYFHWSIYRNTEKIGLALRRKCPYPELFWSVFSRIWTEYGKIRTRITPNTDTFHVV